MKKCLINLLTMMFLLCLLLVPGTTKGAFIDLGWTIYDTSTQLRWEKKLSYCTSYTGLSSATNYCSNLVLSGTDDWYLPSVSQLQGIVDTNYTPTIDPMFCTNPSVYWSSTPYTPVPGTQLVVHFGDGVTYYYNQTYSANWRCVRSSSCSIDDDCSDGAYCNGEEYCDYGACRSGSSPCSDDGLFCNGIEGCDEVNDECIIPDAPCDYCAPLCSCDDEADFCDCTEPDDDDCDTVDNSIDNCPNDYNSGQEDDDLDNVGNICDNCPDDDNPDQKDGDNDGVGDVCMHTIEDIYNKLNEMLGVSP